MAKKQYIVQSDNGATWVIRPEDPAYALAAAIPRGYEPVLPEHTIRTGLLPSVDAQTGYQRELVRLTRGLEILPDDADLAIVVRRRVAMEACVKALEKANMKEPI